MRVQGFGRHGELDLTFAFADFGKPVTVKAPPASDTFDMSEAMRKAKED